MQGVQALNSRFPFVLNVQGVLLSPGLGVIIPHLPKTPNSRHDSGTRPEANHKTRSRLWACVVRLTIPPENTLAQ